MKKNIFKKLLCITVAAGLLIKPVPAYASYMDENKTLPVKSNQVENWPVGPAISAYSAILIDADTGAVLYEKNAHEKMYPASTTKLMTCLLAMEKKNANLNDLVDFSYEAVMTVTRDASNMGMDAGEKMTLEECLYGILVVSANETANAVAEYVSGSISSFVDLMNSRAKELGCTDTHFNNPHGYFDENHYTSAADLSKIAQVFFKSELLSKISRTKTYHWYATEYQPDDFVLASTNYFFRGKKTCEGLVGSKTGFTDESRNTLVSCAERNGMKLICVVMKEETPFQYDDTNLLFDYGFSNFEKIKASDHETKYTVTDETFFHSDSDVFGNSSPLFAMDTNSYIILPKTITFNDISSTLEVNSDTSSDKVANILYDYKGVYLGQASIFFSNHNKKDIVFDEMNPEMEDEKKPTVIYVNYIIYILIALFVIIVLFTIIKKILSNYNFAERIRTSRRWKKRRRNSRHIPSNMSVSPQDRGNASKKRNKSSHYIDI